MKLLTASKQTPIQIFKDYVLMVVGTFVMTLGVYFFKIPNGFATGGVSGIGTLLGKLTPITPATWITILNMSLLVLGFLVLGKETGFRTVVCTLLYSGMMQVLEAVIPVRSPLTEQPFLELVYAMMLTSLGSALIFAAHASSGGTDIIALILKKFTALNVGTALLIADALVAFSSLFVFGIEAGLFSIAGLFAKAFLVDGVIESFNACKHFLIITKKPDEITQFILRELHHGATVVKVEGAYTHEERTALHTVCRRAEAVILQKEIKEIDPGAFTIITTSSEIIGRGFKRV